MFSWIYIWSALSPPFLSQANVAFDEVLILLEMRMKQNMKNVHLDISKHDKNEQLDNQYVVYSTEI